MKYLLDQLEEEVYATRFEDLVHRKVVKHQNIIKAVFYFLGYDKNLICVEDSQLLFWKKARSLWNADLIKKMHNYNFSGPKEHKVPRYKKINFVEKYMQTVSVEELNGYNSSLGLIYRWMQMAIETRKRDIIHRLSISKTKREERAEKEREAAERAEARA